MSKIWKVEIPFDSSDRFPDMLKTMMLFFDKTVVRLPNYHDLSFSEGDYSVRSILEKCCEEKAEMKTRLSRQMSGFYPDDKEELHDHILERLDPEVERFNSLLHEGKLAYTECLRQILGEPSGYTGITVSCFAGLKRHMRHAAKCGDIMKMFEVPYLSDPVNHRKKPLFIRLNNI